MDAKLNSLREHLLFHATGQRSGNDTAGVDGAGLWPALMAPYRDLSRLRHDWPLVLLEEPGPDGPAIPLSTVVSRLAAELAPRGIGGERLRRHLLRLEREIRAAVMQGATGTLSSLWQVCTSLMGSGNGTGNLGDADHESVHVLAEAGASLKLDGLLIGCDERAAARLLTQSWRHAQLAKARQFHAQIDRLMRQLSDIRRAAWVRSRAGQQPSALREAVGAAHADVFDFDAMSRLVARRAPSEELPAARRRRIERALEVLSSQDFWPNARAASALPEGYVFDDCAAAMQAWRARLPAAVELVKAIAI